MGAVASGNCPQNPMTYSLFLLLFLCLPTIALAFTLRGRFQKHYRIALGLVCGLAFFYTTPWDNYAAYKTLWSFDPKFVWGKPLWFGYLPLEEYLFYFAEAIFVCLTLILLSRVHWLKPEED